MMVSFQLWITFLPPFNKFLEVLEGFFWINLLLIRVTYSFQLLHHLFFIPGFDFASDISF